MARGGDEQTPSFSLHWSFQSNVAFLVAIFIFFCSSAWALRDHRKRLLDLATEEQEDRLYLTVLAILFAVSIMGSFYAFNSNKVDATGSVTSSNILVDEFSHALTKMQKKKEQVGPKYTPDLRVNIPLPQPKDIEYHIEQKTRYPEHEYNMLNILTLVFSIALASWYFWPKKRPGISPPRDYMDAGTMPGTNAGRPGTNAGTKKSQVPIDNNPEFKDVVDNQ